MGTLALPPGFRFHPTDEELISCYLKGKLNHALKEAELEVIPEVDVYRNEPWDLPEKSFLPSRDMEWYFFSSRDRKYPNGSRTNRATEAGYWKATGRDRTVYSRASTVGKKKTLVFYRGRAPQGERTDWIMHEYRLEENECEAGPCLQNAFVLCRVFKKSGLGTESGEQCTAPLERGDLSPTEENPSSGYSGDMEVQSEDPSMPVEGIDANLPSKISSKILHDTTGDNAPLNKWLDILLDDTIPNSSCVAADEDTIHTQVDAMPDTPRIQCESACLPSVESELRDIPVNISFPQYTVPNGCLDAYFEEERMLEEMLSVAPEDYTNFKAYHTSLGDTCADILNGGYIKVKNLTPSIGELENHDSCLWEVPYPSFDCEGSGIRLCSGSPFLQSHKQGFSFEGTASRGVCMQLHKMEDSSERYEKDVTVRHSQNTQNDWYDSGPEMQQLHCDRFAGKKWDSENIKENEDSVPEALPTYMAGQIDGLSFQKHDQIVYAAKSAAFVYNSVDDVISITISHNLTSLPLYLSSHGLFVNEEPSEIIEVPTNIFQTTMKDETNCVNDFESLSLDLTPSSSPGNSSPAMSMGNKMFNLKTRDQILSEQYLLYSNKPASIDHVQKSENSAFKNAIGILTKPLFLGKVLHNSGSSLEHGSQMQELDLNSSEAMVVGLHIEDPKPSKSLSMFLSCVPSCPGSAMECNANLNPAKGILDSNVATISGLVCVATTNGHITATSSISTCPIEGVGFRASDTVSSRLRFRKRIEPKNIPFVDKKKRGVVMNESHGCFAKQHIVVPVLVLSSKDSSSVLFQLRKRSSWTGSLAVFLVVCLFDTPVLNFFVFLSWGVWRFTRSFPLLYFSKMLR